jgi:5-methyltetrahydrofolate--homocysteine methyltransferase
MELLYKDDWSRVRQRYEAWWAGEMLDRPIVQVTAPKAAPEPRDVPPPDPDELLQWFTDPEIVIPRLERTMARTYWGGDAFPVAFPFSPSLPAIEAAYLGCPYTVVPGSDTGWASPIIEDWHTRAPIEVNPDNWWWRKTRELLTLGAEAGEGKYIIGIPDIQGGGEIVTLMRGTERMAVDLIDHPDMVKPACAEEIEAWRFYYDTCFEIIHRHADGYADWIGIWSDVPYVSVENDFSIMISPPMFEEFFVPALRLQTEWVDRTIFHLDGPGAIRHLDTLLALPELDGIQWVPGAGASSMIEWLDLLKRIEAGGKRLHLGALPWEVKPLLSELDPTGVVLSTSCSSVDEADRLLDEVDLMFGVRSR